MGLGFFDIRMKELDIDKNGGPVSFGQLLGMCDHVSLPLGKCWALVTFYTTILGSLLLPVRCHCLSLFKKNPLPNPRTRRLRRLQIHPLWFCGGGDPIPDPPRSREPECPPRNPGGARSVALGAVEADSEEALRGN